MPMPPTTPRTRRRRRAEADTILKLEPLFSIAEFAKVLPFRDPEVLDRVVQAMRLAGLPE